MVYMLGLTYTYTIVYKINVVLLTDVLYLFV